MRIAICDDEELYREDTKMKIREILPKTEISFSEFSTGTDLYRRMAEGDTDFDLVVMDVLIGENNGIDIVGRIRQLGITLPVLFLSVSPEFAVYGYDVDAVAYLLKPLEPERLKRTLFKLMQEKTTQRSYIYKKGAVVRKLPIEDIVYAESSNHNLLIHTQQGETLEQWKKLDQLEQEISDACFVRCHQSFYVNMRYVKQLRDTFLLEDGTEVPVTKRDRKAIENIYYNWLLREVF